MKLITTLLGRIERPCGTTLAAINLRKTHLPNESWTRIIPAVRDAALVAWSDCTQCTAWGRQATPGPSGRDQIELNDDCLFSVSDRPRPIWGTRPSSWVLGVDSVFKIVQFLVGFAHLANWGGLFLKKTKKKNVTVHQKIGLSRQKVDNF